VRVYYLLKNTTYLGKRSPFHGGKFPIHPGPLLEVNCPCVPCISPPRPPHPLIAYRAYISLCKDDINKPDSSIRHNTYMYIHTYSYIYIYVCMCFCFQLLLIPRRIPLPFCHPYCATPCISHLHIYYSTGGPAALLLHSLTGPVGQPRGAAVRVRGMHPRLQWNRVSLLAMSRYRAWFSLIDMKLYIVCKYRYIYHHNRCAHKGVCSTVYIHVARIYFEICLQDRFSWRIFSPRRDMSMEPVRV
jgi:hypothetical protein